MTKQGAKTILITGAAGFLGSNLVERALLDGQRVIGIDNLSMGTLDNFGPLLQHPSFTFLQRDVTSPDCFENLDPSIDVVVHLAAFKIPRYGKAIDTLKINYVGTVNALDFAKQRGIKCVLASTSDVYGRNTQLPFKEDGTDSVIGSSKAPRWAYAVSKLMDEHLGLAYQDAYGFPVVLLRFFGSYGPRQHLSWWAGPQSVFIDCVLTGKPIPVHGDGQQTRSFTYASDTVEGIYQATLRDAANGEILNIGSTQEVTILQLAERINALVPADKRVPIELVPYESFSSKKYEDVMRRVPDTALCEKLLGVKAKVDLDTGLRRTFEWQREATERRRAAKPS